MIYLYWFFYLPLLKMISLLVFWIPEFQERLRFEKKNFSDPMSRSFLKGEKKADLCFEFSSEGEYQQVASLVEDALKEGKLVELIYFSPSVEDTVQKLWASYPQQVRALRFPFLSQSFFRKEFNLPNWITSPKLLLVRYDLFPELLFWQNFRKGNLLFLSVTFKRERLKNKKVSWIKKKFLRISSKIFYASEADQEFGTKLGFDGVEFDFRMERIARRLKDKDQKLSEAFPSYPKFQEAFLKYPSNKRLILGNVWPSDLFLFDQIPDDFFVFIIPHKLDQKILNEFFTFFEKRGRDTLISDGTKLNEDANTVILNKKGVLCELYSDFERAYVGGGFEDGVHSLLEPLVSGTRQISCGKLNHRSTEFDVAIKLRRLNEVKTPEEFCQWLVRTSEIENNFIAESIFDSYNKLKKEINLC